MKTYRIMLYNLRHICLIALTILVPQWGTSQTDFRQRQLTMDDGLPSNSVHHIVQDQRGFVWMGTEGGLCRFDGRSVGNFPLTDGTSQRITALLPLGQTDLAIGTTHGAYTLSLTNEVITLLPIELEESVTAMTIDRDGNLWIATSGEGICCWKGSEETVERYPMADSKGIIGSIYADGDNQIWALCSQGTGGLWRLNKTRNAFEPAQIANAEEAPADPVGMLQTQDKCRWVATWEHGLWQLADDNRLIPMPVPSSGHMLHIHSLTQLSAQQLLLASDDGLWLFDTAQKTYSLYLPQRFVYDTMLDVEGGLWVGTDYGGVTYVSPIAQRFDATPGGIITCFAEDRHRRIWTAGSEGGLSCYRQGSKHAEAFNGQAQLRHINVHALCADGDELWIGTYADGIYVLNTLNGKLRHYEADASNEQAITDPNVYAFCRDSQARLWVATTEGLCLYDRKNDCFERVCRLSAPPIDIDEDRDGQLWISTQGGGLCRLDQNRQQKTYRREAKNQQSLSDDIVNCLLIDHEGRIWVGTQGGLCQYDAAIDNFRRVRLDVPRQAVASIAEDQGVLWLSGDCGILKYSPTESLQRFTRQDGLVSEQFQPNAVLKASDGCIYFGTIRGFNSFYPYQIKVNQQLPPVYITQLDIGTTVIAVGDWHLPKSFPDIDKIDLWYNDRMFSLTFASLSYCSPEKNMYAYMLEGFDKDWNYVAGERRATYTSLPAGTYTFRVKATNNDGIWSDREATLKIVIHPPYWWSTPAKIFYVVMLLALVYGIVWLRLKLNNRRHRKELQALSELKEQEMQQARMEFFTTIAHEIRTPVSLIIGPLDQLKEELKSKREERKDGKEYYAQLDIIDRNAHRLLELVNQLLDFRKADQVQEVRFETQNMVELLQSVADVFAPAFRNQGRQFVLSLPEERIIAAVDSEGIRKVVSNLLSNANKYTRDRIGLACRKTSDGAHLCIEVSDNGHGISRENQAHVFEAFFQVAGSKAGTGIGLNIVKRITEAHHGTVSVESEPGRGTTFRVLLPLSQDIVAENSTTTPAAETPTAPTAMTAEKRRMLIVDDNEDMLTFLVTTFMDQYDVTPARNGAEALQLISESLVVKDGQTPTSAFDIVISDWMMDGMEGPELCDRLRQNPATQNLPFIILTAKTDSQSKITAMERGVDAFIEKPFNVKYLEACIKNLFNRKS